MVVVGSVVLQFYFYTGFIRDLGVLYGYLLGNVWVFYGYCIHFYFGGYKSGFGGFGGHLAITSFRHLGRTPYLHIITLYLNGHFV